MRTYLWHSFSCDFIVQCVCLFFDMCCALFLFLCMCMCKRAIRCKALHVHVQMCPKLAALMEQWDGTYPGPQKSPQFTAHFCSLQEEMEMEG